jgi:hypothetical protein
MLEDTPIPNGFSPIQKTTADQRVATFQANSNSIYNKYTPFTTNSIGPSQPFVYTKISASTLSKNLTKYDSQAFPIGSTVRDLQRIGQYSVTGNGLLYLGKQLLMQNTNAFNETRIYNPLSLLKATARPGSLGLIDYPQRHLETSGGILNFFKDALLSTIGIQSKNLSAISKRPIEGTATGGYSNYADARGGARAGVLRYNTAERASTKFNEVWVSAGGGDESSGKFLKNLGNALLKKLTSLIPSTNPLGAFGGKTGINWEYRPEYKNGEDGIYYVFLSDRSGFLTTPHRASAIFYNDKISGAGNAKTTGVNTVKNFHRYYPGRRDPKDTSMIYASDPKIINDVLGDTTSEITGDVVTIQINNLKKLHENMVRTISSFQNEPNQFKKSAERYSEVKFKNPDGKETSYPSYKDIPGKGSTNEKFESLMQKAAGIITLDNRMFAKVSDYEANSLANSSDQYNEYDVINGERGEIPDELTSDDQSQDLIFFYFYDLINKIYVPFRATVTGLSDQHSADWETVEYIGRADKLFLYKGFSRDVNLSFTVYANSALEMLPMWNRINYLVGFTKPSKYTDMGVRTNNTEANINVARAATVEQQSVAMDYDQDTQADLTKIIEALDEASKKNIVSGKESRFIYPPMITFRLGDLFYDQPAVMQSVGVTIPDDTNWESLRAEDYSYIASPTKTIIIDGVKSRQLPMKVDVSVQLKLMEKRQALGSDAHYGNASYSTDGTETGRWLL